MLYSIIVKVKIGRQKVGHIIYCWKIENREPNKSWYRGIARFIYSVESNKLCPNSTQSTGGKQSTDLPRGLALESPIVIVSN